MAGATSLRGCTSRTHTENTAIPGLSLTLSTVEALDQPIEKQGLAVIEVPRPALFLAGKAFVRYRRQGGTKSNVLSDFFIGAHAAVSGHPVLTRDTQRYAAYFPSVKLIAPEAAA